MKGAQRVMCFVWTFGARDDDGGLDVGTARSFWPKYVDAAMRKLTDFFGKALKV